jgi:hypothetical protein
MGTVAGLWNRMRGVFGHGESDAVVRRIVDVDSWDGAASQWPDTAAYCADCLIDVNAAAGREDKAQSHCMLPIRRPEDDSDVYVRQAVYAAAGGRGITRVERPDDVPADDWESAVTAAANRIIEAYGQMDEAAPASVYNMAGREPPEEARAVSMEDIWERVWTMLGQDPELQMPWVHDLYLDDAGDIYVIVSDQGQLYQSRLGVDAQGVHLGEWVAVEVEHVPAGERQRSVWVVRQADGAWRWFALTETAVLLRVGELDSRALFDSFVAEAEERGYPELRFFHDDRLVLGPSDWLAREGNCMLASGTLNDGALAQAFAESCQRGDVWGTSNGFHALDAPALWEIAEGVTVPVYERGYLQEISVLPEQRAASWFTVIGARQEVGRMRTEVAEALQRLFGDEEAADAFIAQVDETNREIEARGMITREADGDQTTEEAVTETDAAAEQGVAATTEEDVETIQVADELLDALAARLPKVDGDAILDGIEELKAKVDDVAAARERDRQEREQLTARIKELERSDAEKREQWLADLPARRVALYRPKEAHDDKAEGEARSSTDIAKGTLASLGN